MKKVNLTMFFFVLVFCSIIPFSHASDLSIEGTCSYSIDENGLTLSVERIVNNESGGTSGTLKISLFATIAPYSGGAISGYPLGEYQFTSVLGGQQYFSGIDQTVDYEPPPSGTYYLTLLLLEYTDSEFYIIDYDNFNATADLGGGTGGGGTGGGDTYTGGEINDLSDCENAWIGSDTDHSQYYCQAACGYYVEGHEQGFQSNCDILSATYEGALANCPVCGNDISLSPALNTGSDGSSTGDSSGSGSGSGGGCLIRTLWPTKKIPLAVSRWTTYQWSPKNEPSRN